ncbi:hypothetical protein LCGC14_0362220 [marine sediment metagenome]|uniref:Uncharacterized protein n=1 Tax=marine sediment metagenome TaxID=412755 RepID=A0A0F9TDK3_9ZZZZ
MTILAVVVVMGCIGMLMYDTPKPLGHDFTTIELCDWAEQQSNNQYRLIVMQLAMSSCILVIVGRIRAKGGIGK